MSRASGSATCRRAAVSEKPVAPSAAPSGLGYFEQTALPLTSLIFLLP